MSGKLDAMEKELDDFAIQIANAVRAHGGLTKKSDMTSAEAWDLIKAFNVAAAKPKRLAPRERSLESSAKAYEPASDEEKQNLVREAHEFVKERRKRNKIEMGP